jgi:transcriptional regulator with XRE-family HTH domain
VDAAQMLGMAKQTYYALENGNRIPKHPDIENYARYFKVSVDWLLTGKKHGVSEASIAKAIEYLFTAVPTIDLALMTPSAIVEITFVIAT